jgi:hypothetical protein
MAFNLMKAAENFGEGLAVVVHGRVSVFAPKTTVRSPQKNRYQHFSPRIAAAPAGLSPGRRTAGVPGLPLPSGQHGG